MTLPLTTLTALPPLPQCAIALLLAILAVAAAVAALRASRRPAAAAPATRIVPLAQKEEVLSPRTTIPQSPTPVSVRGSEEGDVSTPAQAGQVEELRKRARRHGAAEKLPGGERWYEDAELLRFVRARPTLDAAEKLFIAAMAQRSKHCAQWETSTKEGSFGADYAEWASGKSAAPDWWSFLDAHLPQHLYGTDSYGLPIFYSAIGLTDMQGCEREVGLEALERYAVMMNDHFLDLARERARREGSAGSSVVHGGVVIVDLEGLGLRHFGEAIIFKKLGAVAKILHPERQRRCFIVNAPQIFAAVWRLVRPVIDPRTVERITILSSGESLQPVFDELGRAKVPDFLGGFHSGLKRPENPIIPRGAFARWRAGRRRAA